MATSARFEYQAAWRGCIVPPDELIGLVRDELAAAGEADSPDAAVALLNDEGSRGDFLSRLERRRPKLFNNPLRQRGESENDYNARRYSSTIALRDDRAAATHRAMTPEGEGAVNRERPAARANRRTNRGMGSDRVPPKVDFSDRTRSLDELLNAFKEGLE